MKVIEFLKTARNIHSWDRTPAISDEELDELIGQIEPAESAIHGVWIGKFDDALAKTVWYNKKVFDCSVCKGTEFLELPYCPHCWAKMDLKELSDVL